MTVPTVPEPQAPSPFVDLAHERVRRRAEPRASIALAGAGCVLAIAGVLVLAGDRGTSGDDGFNKWPGLIMSVLLVAAGFAVLEVVRRGPVATAGTVATALGVPAVLLFLTIDEHALPPYSTNAILLGSTAAWLASYAAGPGRGRPFFLGAAAVGIWFSLLQLTEKVFTFPFAGFGLFGARFAATDSSSFDPATGDIISSPTGSFTGPPTPHVPDATTIGMISLALGITYLVVSWWLDGRERHGAATPLLFAAIPTLVVGALTLADDLEATGTGILLILVGGGLLLHGASSLRRATTWIGAAVATLGVAVILTDATDDATVGGVLFVLGGIALIAIAYLYSAQTREPDEMLVVPGHGRLRFGPAGPRQSVITEMEQPAESPVEPPAGSPEDWAPPTPPPPDPDPEP